MVLYYKFFFDYYNITRIEIADSIHSEFGLPKKDCIEFVSDIIDIIIEGLQNTNKVKIHNFGTFKLRRKKARLGRNPKTKESVMIPPRNVISFIPSKYILKKLNSMTFKIYFLFAKINFNSVSKVNFSSPCPMYFPP